MAREYYVKPQFLDDLESYVSETITTTNIFIKDTGNTGVGDVKNVQFRFF